MKPNNESTYSYFCEKDCAIDFKKKKILCNKYLVQNRKKEMPK